jgi:chromosome segregation ATPase
VADLVSAQNAVMAGGGAGIALALRELRLYVRDRGHGIGAKRDRQEERIDKLFIEIGELRGEVRALTATNGQLLADRAALQVELSLVTDERDVLRERVAGLETGMQRRRASDG